MKGWKVFLYCSLVVIILFIIVTFLWSPVCPLSFGGCSNSWNNDISCFEIYDKLKIDTNDINTCYDEEKISLRIERYTNSEKLQGFIPIISINGMEREFEENNDLPLENNFKIYVFSLPEVNETPKDVKIFLRPVAESDEKEILYCDGTNFVEIKKCQ